MEILAYEADGKGLRPDLKKLLVSRMLIQANSGGGKSHTIRKLCEILHGHVQQIIIDTEGEFSTLREKYDYVICAAQGGDAIAHPKTAKLLAERLLETGVSAILDIYELKPHERHSFVRLFLEAMVNSPKTLWHPVVVVLDEAHVYAPETDKSEALGAVADIATRGRKRGFCLVAATQRISKLSKDVAAELNNKLIGRTSLDVDVKRAAAELGINVKDALVTLRELEPGNFYAFGPAIGHVPRMVSIGAVATRHPKSGEKYQAPPKPTAAILAVLPKLADLPKESEEKAKSEADLRRELADTRRELAALKKAAVRSLETGRAHIKLAPAVSKADLKAEYTRGRADGFTAGDAAGRKAVSEKVKSGTHAFLKSGLPVIQGMIQEQFKTLMESMRTIAGLEAGRTSEPQKQFKYITSISVQPLSQKQEPMVPAGERVERRTFEARPINGMPGPHQKLLNALAWLQDKGIYPAPKNTLAAVAGVSPTSGTYGNNLSSMKTSGLIEYPTPGHVGFTEVGGAAAQRAEDDGKAVHDKWLEMLNGPHQKIVRALLAIGGANEMSKDELAEAINVSTTSGTYGNNLSSLKTLGAIHYPKPGRVALTNYVIPE